MSIDKLYTSVRTPLSCHNFYSSLVKGCLPKSSNFILSYVVSYTLFIINLLQSVVFMSSDTGFDATSV